MLRIVVPKAEYFDDEAQQFIMDGDVLELEHSLVSLSKWEQKFKKPFLVEGDKTDEEILYYIECMIISPDFPADVLMRLSQENLKDINDYIDDPATATWFNDSSTPSRTSETITSELIYYWMLSQGVPKECEIWHLNRLTTLLRIFNVKNSKPKKMTRAELRRINEQRRAQYETTG